MNRKRDAQTPQDEEAWNLSRIRQRPTRFNVPRVGDSVRRLMTRSGYGQTEAAESLQNAWAAAVGEQLAARSRPGNISRGVLSVHVADSPTMQEISFSKRGILKKLIAALPEAKLRDLRTRITNLD